MRKHFKSKRGVIHIYCKAEVMERQEGHLTRLKDTLYIAGEDTKEKTLQKAIDEIYDTVEWDLATQTHSYTIEKLKNSIIYEYEKTDLDTEDMETVKSEGYVRFEVIEKGVKT